MSLAHSGADRTYADRAVILGDAAAGRAVVSVAAHASLSLRITLSLFPSVHSAIPLFTLVVKLMLCVCMRGYTYMQAIMYIFQCRTFVSTKVWQTNSA